jgi:hypothetical protein
VYKDNFELVNLKLSGIIEYNYIKFNCNIVQEENENGLLVNIEYKSNEQLETHEIRKFAKYFEGEILEVKYDDEVEEVHQDLNDDEEPKLENYDSDIYEENDNNNGNEHVNLEYNYLCHTEPYYDYEYN